MSHHLDPLGFHTASTVPPTQGGGGRGPGMVGGHQETTEYAIRKETKMLYKGYETDAADRRAFWASMLLAVFMFGIIVGTAVGFTARPLPYCQEDEVILFNLPERDSFWCAHIDSLSNAN